MDLKGKSFLKLLDLTPAEIEGLLALAAKLKAEKKAGIPHKLCQGKNIVLLFAKIPPAPAALSRWRVTTWAWG